MSFFRCMAIIVILVSMFGSGFIQADIIEIGSNQPGEIKMLTQIVEPTAGLITNIGRGHLEYFSSIEGVSREKNQLFKGLKRNALIFLNCDDPHLPQYDRSQAMFVDDIPGFALQESKRC